MPIHPTIHPSIIIVPRLTRSVRKLRHLPYSVRSVVLATRPTRRHPSEISGTQRCRQPGCSFPALCFPSVSNLQDGGEAVKDDRKSNCHHKKASVITFRPRFRLEGNTRLIYRLDGTHSQSVEPPSTRSAFEARLINPCSHPAVAAAATASPSILSLQRSLAADLKTTNFPIYPPYYYYTTQAPIMAKAESDLLNRDLVSRPPPPSVSLP